MDHTEIIAADCSDGNTITVHSSHSSDYYDAVKPATVVRFWIRVSHPTTITILQSDNPDYERMIYVEESQDFVEIVSAVYDVNLEIKVEVTVAGTKVEMTEPEIVFDKPYDLGCYVFENVNPSGGAEASDAESCAAKCASEGKGFSAVTALDQCLCYESLENATKTSCEDIDGSRVRALTCGQGMIRFGEFCLVQLEDQTGDLFGNMDACMEKVWGLAQS